MYLFTYLIYLVTPDDNSSPLHIKRRTKNCCTENDPVISMAFFYVFNPHTRKCLLMILEREEERKGERETVTETLM